MNRFIVFFMLSIFLSSCIGKHKSDAHQAKVGVEKSVKSLLESDTVHVDLSQSSINWKGTKMGGVGKHEGIIHIKSAHLITENKSLKSGAFILDMTTISVTDIPVHEPIPRRNLNNHLKSEDFFDVKKYPTSKFEITNVHQLSNDSLEVFGNLTIKNITNSIQFKAAHNADIFTAQFTFDRFLWNVAYEGNWTDKTFVDKEIELRINLVVE